MQPKRGNPKATGDLSRNGGLRLDMMLRPDFRGVWTFSCFREDHFQPQAASSGFFAANPFIEVSPRNLDPEFKRWFLAGRQQLRLVLVPAVAAKDTNP